MAEPSASVFPGALDSVTTLKGDALNLKQFTLDAGINASVQTISVSESIAAVNFPVYCLIDSEVIYSEAASSGDFATCTRGADGTTAATHLSGAKLYLVPAANYNNIIKSAIIAIETELGLNPSGGSATVVARLDTLDTTVAAKAPSASPTFTGTVTLPKTTEIHDTSADHQYVLGVSELTSDRTITLPLLTGNDTFVFQDHTQTLTNKRITKRVVTVTVAAAPAINIDNGDIFTITSQNAAITSMTTNLTGTPTSGQKIIIEILDDGTARAITWGASFASGPATLPTTTILSKWLYVGFEYSSSRSKWICMATGSEV